MSDVQEVITIVLKENIFKVEVEGRHEFSNYFENEYLERLYVQELKRKFTAHGKKVRIINTKIRENESHEEPKAW